ncbi:hypothetical protein KBY96_03445 [Cyanobium sp. ATX 6A2]|nr:hypothetical protein [Cyanobium sp. ATX 6A2]
MAVEISQLRAVEQVQQSLELASVVGAGVELEGKPASIKSSSDSIQARIALSFLSCSVSFSSCFPRLRDASILISTSGSRRQLSIDKNERKRERDEPHAPLLGEVDSAVGDVDVVIRGEQGNQGNDGAKQGFHDGLDVEAQPVPGLGNGSLESCCRIHTPR